MARAVRKVINTYHRHRIPMTSTLSQWKSIATLGCPDHVKAQLETAILLYSENNPTQAHYLEARFGALINDWLRAIKTPRSHLPRTPLSDQCLVIMPDKTWHFGIISGNTIHTTRQTNTVPSFLV